jgi:hypothetical protein
MASPMPEPAGEPGPIDPALQRLAAALGVPAERLERALTSHGWSARDLLAAARAGASDSLVQDVAGALRVDRVRLVAAALESLSAGEVGVGAMQGMAAAFRGTAEEALSVGLEILGESIPRMLNHLLAVLAVAGVALVALGLMAIFATTLFVQLLAILAGLALVATGIGLFTLAWRVHEATATLRTLARVARRMRAKQRERAPAEADA